mmetsp:Transcript_15927/g.45808  ORF Transcript_15927/g.45808 Transcript_15927/m.45808 type:complete len:759 (-) Transcript_15927:130-2406(-)
MWIDTKEHFHEITYKTATFFAVVDRLTRELGIDYAYAMKTDDDSYVALDRIASYLDIQVGKPDYVGKCVGPREPFRNPSSRYYTSYTEYPEEFFPEYCQGLGFLLSSHLIECVVTHMENCRFLKHEDVFIGSLAQRCQVKNTLAVPEYNFRPYRSGCMCDDLQTVHKEMEGLKQDGNSVDDNDLSAAEMAARMIQHRINSDADMIRHYRSHLDSRLILSSEDISVGDFVEYYFSDEYGWLGADVKNVSNFVIEGKKGTDNSSPWLQVGLYFRMDQEFESVEYMPFWGTMRKSARRQTTDFLGDHISQHTSQSHYKNFETLHQYKRNYSDTAQDNTSKSISPAKGTTSIILQQLDITENNSLFKEEFYPLLENYLNNVEFANSSSTSERCEPESAEATYIKTMRSVMLQLNETKDYDNFHWGALHPCPLTLLFYYEQTDAEKFNNFLRFYHRFDNRCIKFAVPWDFVDSDEIALYEQNTGFQFIRSSARYSNQNKVINDALGVIRNSYGPYCLVSVNDMDHYLLWQHRGGATGLQPASKKFYKYSSYSNAAMLYMYSFLSAPECGNKNVHETMVAPCTCLLENNTVYRKIDEPFFSEYGETNMFHPSMNFWVQPEFVDNVGTVFSNLDSPLDAVAHHTMGEHMPSFKLANPITPSVLHLRRLGGILPSIEKYAEFLDGTRRNQWSSNDGTIAEALACVKNYPRWIIENKRICGKVKEISNILAILIQRNRCLDAGIDRFVCDNESPCCTTLNTFVNSEA